MQQKLKNQDKCNTRQDPPALEALELKHKPGTQAKQKPGDERNPASIKN
jgi:hypothetical protein